MLLYLVEEWISLMSEFYYPETKKELIKLIAEKYPADLKRFKKMKIGQLRAIRASIIREHLKNK